MRNIRLTLEYDGTQYHGWQSQKGTGRATIQDALEQSLFSLTGVRITTAASGRTDARVHALGQVVNFHTTSRIPAASWAPALNQLLPHDIRVTASGEADEHFHARHSATGKVYTYRILNRPAQTALARNYCWHIPQALDLRKMRKAAVCLLGKHDFSAFRGSGCAAKNPVRTITSLKIGKRLDFVELKVEADAFLQYMVRNITGTLVEAGLGRFRPEGVRDILLSRDRTKAGKTAPPQGLFLTAVHYGNRRRSKKV
ncbi:MAG TPA: tRNA pseudouridine(38-40) synthase TruA [Nitrospirota bacterium]|nr:tRNA pseudouridine(38-40) synthase TruA [Nitrospirota bacterium]